MAARGRRAGAAAPGATSKGATSTGAGRATTIVGIGMIGMNALAYGFTLLAAHVLGPSDFGGVGALLGVVIVANVGSLAVQATAARRLATTSVGERSAVRRDVLRTGRRLSAVVGVVLLGAVPLLDVVLHLHDWIATVMVAFACTALTMMGAYAGIAQGERRWAPLAALYLSMGVGRLVAGGIALAVDTSIRSAMAGVAVGSLLPLFVGRRWCVPVAVAGAVATTPLPPQRSDPAPVAELWRNGHTLLAFFAFTNVDVLLARNLFSAHDAGIYASGAILTKACLFLPTFVLVVAFPAMATDRGGRAWLRPLQLVAALGACSVLGALLLPGLAEAFAGGSDYTGLGDVAWLFALEGTLFAALQILVYETIAGQSHATSLVWAGVAVAAVTAVVAVHTVTALVAVMAGTAVVVSGTAAALAGRRPSPLDSSASEQAAAAR